MQRKFKVGDWVVLVSDDVLGIEQNKKFGSFPGEVVRVLKNKIFANGEEVLHPYVVDFSTHPHRRRLQEIGLLDDSCLRIQRDKELKLYQNGLVKAIKYANKIK